MFTLLDSVLNNVDQVEHILRVQQEEFRYVNFPMSLLLLLVASIYYSAEEDVFASCGGRVVILLYCPSYFLMETGLYW